MTRVAWPRSARRRARLFRQGADGEERGRCCRARRGAAPDLAELAGMSANAITAALNERGVPTPRGGPWHAMSVIRVQRRLGIA